MFPTLDCFVRRGNAPRRQCCIWVSENFLRQPHLSVKTRYLRFDVGENTLQQKANGRNCLKPFRGEWREEEQAIHAGKQDTGSPVLHNIGSET